MVSDGDRPADRTSPSLSPLPPRFTRQAAGALLLVAGGPDHGRELLVAGGATALVGTAGDCDLVLSDPSVSRKHLKVTATGAGLQVRDLGSKNGSYLSDVQFQEVLLPHGAVFRAGTTTLKVLPDEQVLYPAASDTSCFGALVGQSAVMRQLFTLIDQVAASDLSVLVEGETGAGKEVVAEEIHRRSARRDAPFVIFDAGAVPEHLVESSLFGHLRGAFTGAVGDRPGVFTDAEGGTLFLDEIGELRSDLQPNLLRALDRKAVKPLGATRYVQVDVRIVAATNRALGAMVAAGAFREDLYYRLAVVRLSVPPLRDRIEDLPHLVRHFLHRVGRPDLEVDGEALERLAAHPWPGNVRELRNVVEQGVAFARDGRVAIEDVLLRPGAPPRLAGTAPAAAGLAGERPEGALAPFRDAKAAAIESFERSYLGRLVAENDTLAAAAQAAGMDRKHLRLLLRRYGITLE